MFTTSHSSRSPSSVEALETRNLLSAYISGDTLFIGGTSGPDTLTLSLASNKQIVNLNGLQRSFDLSRFNHIVVQTRGGDDNIDVRLRRASAVVNAGAGNDTVLEGDTIYGGPGKIGRAHV
jgi:hypothetical protein